MLATWVAVLGWSVGMFLKKNKKKEKNKRCEFWWVFVHARYFIRYCYIHDITKILFCIGGKGMQNATPSPTV